MGNYTPKKYKIKKEYEKLQTVIADVAPNKKDLAERFIREVAYMSVTLEDIKKEYDKNGKAVELFENGSQRMYRENTALKAYNNLIKNYNTTLKQLKDLIPDGQAKADDLDEFTKRR